tara:strand:- start:1554 stop:2291 length:738 start_codon:yes stop_codon:yes gene_type:complete
MNKALLHSIVSLGFIRSHCNIATLGYVGRDLHCNFVSTDRTVTCNIIAEKFNDGDDFLGGNKIGLPNVDSFLKMLKTLGKDISASVYHEGRNDRVLLLDDETMQMKYGVLADSQMPLSVKLKTAHLSTQPVTITIDPDFIKRFHKLSGAIKDCKYLFIKSKDGIIELILSQTEDYNTGATIPFERDDDTDDIEIMKFDIKKFRMLLYNNRTMTDGNIQFHREGLCIIKFTSEKNKTKVVYYVISE